MQADIRAIKDNLASIKLISFYPVFQDVELGEAVGALKCFRVDLQYQAQNEQRYSNFYHKWSMKHTT